MHASRVIVLITTIVLLCFPYQSVTAVRISVKHSRILVVMWLMGVFHFQIHCSSSQVSRTIKCQLKNRLGLKIINQLPSDLSRLPLTSHKMIKVVKSHSCSREECFLTVSARRGGATVPCTS